MHSPPDLEEQIGPLYPTHVVGSQTGACGDDGGGGDGRGGDGEADGGSDGDADGGGGDGRGGDGEADGGGGGQPYRSW